MDKRPENEIAFSNNYMATMQRYVDLEQTIKELEKTKKDIRAEIQEAMEAYNVRSIDNDILNITWVAPSASTSVDTAAVRIAKPDLYDDLLERFPKKTERKASLRVTVK